MGEGFSAASAWDGPDAGAPPPTVPLKSAEVADLAVIGGGILGLACALRAVRAGLSVRVIEAGEIGAGASGVNGGQVIPGLKYDPSWLVRHYGPQRGEALVRFAGSTADQVFGLIAREGLAVPHRRAGWIQAAHTPAAAEIAAARAREWADLGVAAKVLDAAAMAQATGAQGYVGGWLDPRAGVVQPLAYTRALARLAAAGGARIATGTRAVRLRRASGYWEVGTAQGGSVAARSVVVAVNAYADGLVPGLRRTLVPLHSFQIATAPLSPELQDRILPDGPAVSDSRHILVYYRKSPDGRLVLGGRGRMAEPAGPAHWAHLERAMLRLYPFLKGTPVERRWFGRLAVTLDHLPHLHEPEPGLLVAAGCQGRGVALMTALGPCLADYLRDGDPGHLPLPLTPIRPIPFHGLRNIGTGLAISWYRLLDALDR